MPAAREHEQYIKCDTCERIGVVSVVEIDGNSPMIAVTHGFSHHEGGIYCVSCRERVLTLSA